jgi:hypothetical protein
MHDMQSRLIQKGQSEHFANRGGTTRRIGRIQVWPTRTGDRLPSFVRRRARPISNPAEVKQPSPKIGPDIRRPTALEQFFAAFSLERSFTLFGFLVAVSLVSFFGLDLACGWPFRHASFLFDTTSTICGAVLAFLCWDVFWEQAKGQTR